MLARSKRGRGSVTTDRRDELMLGLRVRWLVAALGASLGLILAAPAPAAATLDDFAAKCPTGAEIASVQSDFNLTVTADPSPPAAGCPGLTELQRRLYLFPLFLRSLNFARPLPWTNLSIYDWFNTTVAGIRIDPAETSAFCCEPGPTIVVNDESLGDPWAGNGLIGFTRLAGHEARHTSHPHNCGATPGNDNAISDQGAWAVDKWVGEWIGLFGGASADASSPNPPSFWRERTLDFSVSSTRFCNGPFADLSVTNAVPSEVRTGEQLTYSTTLINTGPAAAPRTYLSHDPAPGLQFVSASTDRGPCLTPAETGGGPAVCELGEVAAGTSVSGTFTYMVTATAGTILGYSALGTSTGSPRVIADVDDANFTNNSSFNQVLVTPAEGGGGGIDAVPVYNSAGKPKTNRRGRAIVVKPGFSVTCPANAADCTAAITASALNGRAGKAVVIGKANLTVPGGSTKTVIFKLNTKGEQLLAGRRSLKARLTVVGRVGDAQTLTGTKAFSIRRPRP